MVPAESTLRLYHMWDNLGGTLVWSEAKYWMCWSGASCDGLWKVLSATACDQPRAT